MRYFRCVKIVLFPRTLTIFLPAAVPPMIQFQVPITVLVILLIVKVPVTDDTNHYRCSLVQRKLVSWNQRT